MNKNKFENLKIFLNFQIFHFSVGQVLMLANFLWKKKTEVQMRSKVRGFGGILS